MTTHKKKKRVNYRGSNSCGGGHKKKRRGGGSRGGRGNAGTGKRADVNWPSVSGLDYFGKFGFKKKNADVIKAVTLAYLDEKWDVLVAKSLAEDKQGVIHINLHNLGAQKLLGTGIVHRKLVITADAASAGAVEKVKSAGGSVIVKEKEEVKEKKEKEGKAPEKKEKAAESASERSPLKK